MIHTKQISPHSHIKSLGLNDAGMPISTSTSLVGQENAREAAGLIVDMVKQRKMAGKAILISGPMGSGKTALAVAISEDLGPKTPFTSISGSQVYSSEIKKTEKLQECIRRSILVRIREFKDIYEGEVTDLKIVEDNLFVKTIGSITITLKANRGSKILKLNTSMYPQIEKQRIAIGDVVYIEAVSGVIRRLGRSESFMSDYDLEADKYVPLPKGEVVRRKEVMQEVTLHDLDMSISKPTSDDMISLMSQIISPKRTEITEKLRSEVNVLVNSYVESGNAEIIPGVLFIDEVHMLDLECLIFFHKIMESSISPTIIFATNKGVSPIRGTENILSPFGMPKELLDRLVIISVEKNSAEVNTEIVKQRIKEERLLVSREGVELLGTMVQERGLRYVLSILPLLSGDCVDADNIREIVELFH